MVLNSEPSDFTGLSILFNHSLFSLQHFSKFEGEKLKLMSIVVTARAYQFLNEKYFSYKI